MPVERFRRRWVVAATGALLLLGLYYSFASYMDPRTAVSKLRNRINSASERLKAPEAANSTLGLGGVYVISSANAMHKDRLRETARLTEIDLTVLELKKPKSSEIKALRKAQSIEMSENQSIAWLYQVAALQKFLDSRLESILILGEDVDWTGDLRSSQIPVAAATVQKITIDQVGFSSQIIDQPELRGYWGVKDSWDILNLGDCGEYSSDPQWKANVPHLAFPDQGLRRRDEPKLPGSPGLNVRDGQHLSSRSDSPLCASGYAVTRQSAQRLLDALPAKEKKTKAALTYDERITELCRDSVLRCLSISPRLLHRIDT